LSASSEIKAILTLLDDPDELIYQSIQSKIISMGNDIVAHLEKHWDENHNELVRERIETLIHLVSYQSLLEDFNRWLDDEHPTLLVGSLIIARYHYPDLMPGIIFQQIEKLRKNIWLELNNYLTPIEQIHVFNSVFYHFNRQQSTELDYDQPDAFLINKVLENRSGNVYGNACLYIILCELLDIPVYPVFLPNHILLGYQKKDVVQDVNQISFFIDPLNGQLYSQQDLIRYLQKTEPLFHPTKINTESSLYFIKMMIEALSKCFDNPMNVYKKNDLLNLANKIS
jgi:regulator of sirC expression with transglutaminase-like and TPR domain